MNDSTSDTIKVDTARLPLLLRELRLPTIAAMWQSFTERPGMWKTKRRRTLPVAAWRDAWVRG